MTRECGSCTLCCKLLPVVPLGKLGGQRCTYQRHGKGCSIYASRPPPCRAWSCVWLLNAPEARDLSRPDRVRYVIDPMPDFVRLRDNETGTVTNLPVIQIWLDAIDAHTDPGLRAYLAAEAERTGMGALARTPGNNGAIGLFAPAISADRQWHIVHSEFKPEQQHSAADIAEAMAAAGLNVKMELVEE